MRARRPTTGGHGGRQQAGTAADRRRAGRLRRRRNRLPRAGRFIRGRGRSSSAGRCPRRSRTLPASPGHIGRGHRVRRAGTRRRLAPAAAVHRVAPGLRDGRPPLRGAESRNHRNGAAGVRVAVSGRTGCAATIPGMCGRAGRRGEVSTILIAAERDAGAVTAAPRSKPRRPGGSSGVAVPLVHPATCPRGSLRPRRPYACPDGGSGTGRAADRRHPGPPSRR
jgi:hypothetical protein